MKKLNFQRHLMYRFSALGREFCPNLGAYFSAAFGPVTHKTISPRPHQHNVVQHNEVYNYPVF